MFGEPRVQASEVGRHLYVGMSSSLVLRGCVVVKVRHFNLSEQDADIAVRQLRHSSPDDDSEPIA